jgi:hypothetical protein
LLFVFRSQSEKRTTDEMGSTMEVLMLDTLVDSSIKHQKRTLLPQAKAL